SAERGWHHSRHGPDPPRREGADLPGRGGLDDAAPRGHRPVHPDSSRLAAGRRDRRAARTRRTPLGQSRNRPRSAQEPRRPTGSPPLMLDRPFRRGAIALAVVALLALPCPAAAQGVSVPGISITGTGGPTEVSTLLEIVAGLTVLALAPSILIMLT